MKFEVKMMPGQEPYTEAELQKLYGMIGAACEAEECFEDYELEDHAKAQAKTHPSKSKS